MRPGDPRGSQIRESSLVWSSGGEWMDLMEESRFAGEKNNKVEAFNRKLFHSFFDLSV